MSPTVFRYKQYRLYFFSREEERIHVHAYCSEGEAKFWIEPKVSVARNYRLSQSQISELIGIVEDHKDEITDAWQKHFGR